VMPAADSQLDDMADVPTARVDHRRTDEIRYPDVAPPRSVRRGCLASICNVEARLADSAARDEADDVCGPGVSIMDVVRGRLLAETQGWAELQDLANLHGSLEASLHEPVCTPAESRTDPPQAGFWTKRQGDRLEAAIILVLAEDVSHASEAAIIARLQLPVGDVMHREEVGHVSPRTG
jgi:hypothetical protein